MKSVLVKNKKAPLKTNSRVIERKPVAKGKGGRPKRGTEIEIDASKLKLHNKRMIMVMKYVVENNIKGIDSRAKFLDSIGFNNTNFFQISTGQQSFTSDQIFEAGKFYGLDYNFIYKEDHTKMFSDDPGKSAFEELMQATLRVGIELKSK